MLSSFMASTRMFSTTVLSKSLFSMTRSSRPFDSLTTTLSQVNSGSLMSHVSGREILSKGSRATVAVNKESIVRKDQLYVMKSSRNGLPALAIALANTLQVVFYNVTGFDMALYVCVVVEFDDGVTLFFGCVRGEGV